MSSNTVLKVTGVSRLSSVSPFTKPVTVAVSAGLAVP